MNPMIKKVLLGAGAIAVAFGVKVGKRILRREAGYAAAVGVVATVDAAAQAMSKDSTAAPKPDSAAAPKPDSSKATVVNAPAPGTQIAAQAGKLHESAERAVAAANARTEASSTLPAEAQQPASAPVAVTKTDSAAGKAEVKSAGAQFERETFLYDKGGRRDPFISLMSTSELRPLISDLRLVAIAYDAAGKNSVAVLHDISTKDKQQYRIRTGQSLGRMRVSGITPRGVVFTIEEFGYSRQETLAMGDSNKERKQ